VFDAAQPHNDLPLLPPKQKLETERVLRTLGNAKASLASLKEAGRLVPDQSVILQSMILQEAKLSSEIENIFTTHDELYRQIEIDETLQSPAVKEIRRYRNALWAGYQAIKHSGHIDVGLILEVASQILERPAKIRGGGGTVVGNRRRIVYTPPVGEARIRGLLDNWLDFLRTERSIDPLVRIAVAHYQFEAIHPFDDGNGRTGRILNILLLVLAGILDLPILYLSQEFLYERAEYYRRLQGVTERGEWVEWVDFFLGCVDATAIVTRCQFGLISGAIQGARARVRAESKLPSEIVDLVFSKPYTRIGDVVAAGIAKRQTAAAYLRELESLGILRSSRQWREVLFLNPRLLEILSLEPSIP